MRFVPGVPEALDDGLIEERRVGAPSLAEAPGLLLAGRGEPEAEDLRARLDGAQRDDKAGVRLRPFGGHLLLIADASAPGGAVFLELLLLGGADAGAEHLQALAPLGREQKEPPLEAVSLAHEAGLAQSGERDIELELALQRGFHDEAQQLLLQRLDLISN